jgi:hypothetical protein
MSKKNLMAIIRENRTLFIVMAVGLLLVELEIFLLAAMKSGDKSVIQVSTAAGDVIYEADGNNLSQFDRYYFEQNFGPLDQYHLRLVTRRKPFPFRAWFVAAFGLPVGGILLFAFLVRVYLTTFYPDQVAPAATAAGMEDGSRIERLLLRISRYNIFIIGFLLLLGILAYWVVPNLIATLGRLSIETIVRYKWFFLGAAAIGLGLIVWVIYLRYLLARRSIESQTELEKHRLELEYRMGAGRPRLAGAEQAGLVAWEGEILPASASQTAPPRDPSHRSEEHAATSDADRDDP